VSLVKTVVGDALFGLRTFARKPGFTVAAVLALALGIAVNTAMFSVVYATLLAPLPYPEPDELVTLWPSSGPGSQSVFSASELVPLMRELRSFRAVHAWTLREVGLGIGETAEATSATLATPGYVSMMGAGMTLGRDFLPEEGTIGRDRVAILSHRFWRERFGGDPGVIGRTVRVDGERYGIVGVLAPASERARQTPLTLPLAFTEEQLAQPYYLFLFASARLKPAVTPAQAAAEASAVFTRLQAARPSPSGPQIEVELLAQQFVGPERKRTLWLLMGAVACVLLIACANVAHLLLTRGAARRREVALRASLGASRRRIFAQFLAESAALAAVGGVAGTALAFALVRATTVIAAHVVRPEEMRISLPVLGFTAAATMASTLLFGFVPAWSAMRTDPIQGLKDGGYATIGSRRSVGRRLLVAAEFALALTVLAGGGLVVHDLLTLASVDPGLKPDGVLTFRLTGPGSLPTRDTRIPVRPESFRREVTDAIRAQPGVEGVALAGWLPVQGAMFARSFDVVDRPEGGRTAAFDMVTPEYFGVLGIDLTAGRPFSVDDGAQAPLVAVVNEAFARRHLAGLDPLGQRLVVTQDGAVPMPAPSRVWQIVGVARDVRSRGARSLPPQPTIHVPFAQNPWPETWVAVRTSVEPGSVRAGVAAALGRIEPDLVMRDVMTLRQRVDRVLAAERFNAALFGAFGALALALAALGIYGVTSFAVAQRTREIGLRMALGADRARVLWAVVREGMTTVLWGAAVGVFGAYAAIRSVGSLVHAVRPADPAPLVVVTALLLAAAFVACVLPARRAALVDPLVALRED
jgi:putative ABC transport system permease protein